jgi:hypothetical protein
MSFGDPITSDHRRNAMSLLDKTNVLNLSKNGTFHASGTITSTPADVDALFTRLSQEKSDHLVLYFHGGLVPEAKGYETAEKLYPLIHDRAKAHPLFFIWESGGLEVIKNNLDNLASTPLYKELLRNLLKYALSKLGGLAEGRGIGDTVTVVNDAEVQQAIQVEGLGGTAVDPTLQTNLGALSNEQREQFESLLNNSLSFQNAADQVANALSAEIEGRGLGPAEKAGKANLDWFSPEALAALQAEVDPAEEAGRGLITTAFLVKLAVGILSRVIGRLIERTDHGLVCTATEEILRELYLDKVGGWAWSEMKQETAEAFASNAGLTGDLLHGGTYFLDRLNTYVKNKANPKLKVSMVGHSAGSIYICNLFKAALKKLPAAFKFNKIAFLAPGVDFDLFNATLVDHHNRFKEFRMFTMNDEMETKDVMIPLVYPRSLLYFVSGALEGKDEKPIVGLERFYSGKKPYQGLLFEAVSNFVKSATPARVVWSRTVNGQPGLNSAAEHHGGFALEPVTQDSLAAYLAS